MAREVPSAPVVAVLGVPVHRVNLELALATIAGWIEDARGTKASASNQPPLRHIVTLNPEMVMAAQDDAEFGAIVRRADLTTADGIGVVWAARLHRHNLARLTGIDLLLGAAELAAERGYRLFFLGAEPGVAAAAALVLARRYPGLLPIGTLSGSPKAEAEVGILAELAESKPDVVFVAFGSPAQERWISDRRRQLESAGVSVAVGVGGAFDAVSGRVPRAPYWMRQVGLEWLYRLLRQPWRWRRMLALPRFALAIWQAR